MRRNENSCLVMWELFRAPLRILNQKLEVRDVYILTVVCRLRVVLADSVVRTGALPVGLDTVAAISRRRHCGGRSICVSTCALFVPCAATGGTRQTLAASAELELHGA